MQDPHPRSSRVSLSLNFDKYYRGRSFSGFRYATGLVLISPLGDLLRRRSLILCIVALSTCLTIGLAVTSNLAVFEALSFLVGVLTVTPQILIPLAADLAPENRRASAISVVLSGLLFGILIARVLAGVIAQFVSWRVVYYFSIGVQTLVLFGSYFMLPDYPSKNADLTYLKILWTMAKFSVTEPILIQACLVNMASSACFSNFWVTLTFLLGGPPYFYSTSVVPNFWRDGAPADISLALIIDWSLVFSAWWAWRELRLGHSWGISLIVLSHGMRHCSVSSCFSCSNPCRREQVV